MARLPVLKYLTPALLKLLNDVAFLILKGQGDTEEDRIRRRNNFFTVLLLAEASLFGFYMDGYLMRSLFFDLNFLLAILVSILAAVRMKTRNLLALILSSAFVSFVVEHAITSDEIVIYTGSAGPTLFAVSGWVMLLIAIFGISDLLRQWLARLHIFDKLSGWRALPFAAAVAAFSLFFYLEGYFEVAGREVLVMYAVMALLGLFYSNRCSIDWNASLVIASIAVGGYMELLGTLAGLWSYSLTDAMPIFITLAWAINSGAVHGIASLAGIDLSSSTAKGSAEDRTSKRFEMGSRH